DRAASTMRGFRTTSSRSRRRHPSDTLARSTSFMQTISELKEQAVTETPLLLFDCTFSDGRTEHWSTNRVTVDAIDYEPRVLRHNVFEIQTASDQGVDGIPRISLVLADADSHFSQLEHSAGMKGAKLIAKFMFFDLREGTAATEATVVF